MKKSEIIEGVSNQIGWWMGERRKKLAELRHSTMSVNPFLLPLIFGIHQFKNTTTISPVKQRLEVKLL